MESRLEQNQGSSKIGYFSVCRVSSRGPFPSPPPTHAQSATCLLDRSTVRLVQRRKTGPHWLRERTSLLVANPTSASRSPVLASDQKPDAFRSLCRYRDYQGGMIMSSTHDLFIDFASFGAGRQTLQQMDGRSFAKLCRDCRLIDRALTLIDVDILFTKVKVRTLVPCGMCGVQIGARGSLPHPLPLSPWHVCRCTAVMSSRNL